MNPSAQDFIKAFDEVNADVIFVFPNNGNIILTAQQAANLYRDSDVRVIDSDSIGSGYVSLAMLDTSSCNADAIVEDLEMAMDGVITAEISKCVRDATVDGVELHTGEYIGFVGKRLLGNGTNRLSTVFDTIEGMCLSDHDACIVFCGKEATEEEAAQIQRHVKENYRNKEIYIIDGGQDIYDYIIVVE